MPDKTVIRVVAGVLRGSDGRYLIAKRRSSGSNANEWEFPGGKVEPDETDAQALERELQEELNIRTQTGEFLCEIPVTTETRILRIEYYRTAFVSGEMRAIECADFAFVHTDEFSGYHMSYADRLMADRLTEG